MGTIEAIEIIKEHEDENGIELRPLVKKHILEILDKVDRTRGTQGVSQESINFATDFMNWTLTAECEYECTDEDQWNTPNYSESRETISTKTLVYIYMKNFRNNQ